MASVLRLDPTLTCVCHFSRSAQLPMCVFLTIITDVLVCWWHFCRYSSDKKSAHYKTCSSVNFDLCISPCNWQILIQHISSTPESPFVILNPPPPAPASPWATTNFLLLWVSFACFRILHKWNHTGCTLSLVSFPQHDLKKKNWGKFGTRNSPF